MAMLTSKDFVAALKVTKSRAWPGSNLAKLACACKSETFNSLHGHALLILGETFKSKK